MPRASLVFQYFGDKSPFVRFAQETVPLHLGMEGYDRSVLLHHATDAGPFHLSGDDEKTASVIDTPTRENLAKYLNELSVAGYEIDVFVFSHGGKDYFLASDGTYGNDVPVWAGYLPLHCKDLPIRAVWSCACYGATLNPMWRTLGASVTAGARSVNFTPTRWRGFIGTWKKGKAFGDAVASSDTSAVRTPVQGYLVADALGRLKEWDGKAWEAASILSATKASERYFTRCWLSSDEWQKGLSGKRNMVASSELVIDGDPSVLWRALS